QRAGLTSEEFLISAHLLDAVFDAIIVTDPEGNIVYANKSAYLSRGYEREEFLKMNVIDLVPPERQEITRNRLKELSSGRLTHFESVHLHKDGHRIYLEARGSLTEIGGRKYYVAVARDISEQVAAEQQLKKTQELLNSILVHAPMPIFSATVEGNYQLVNLAWEALTGKGQERVIGRSYEDLFSPGAAKLFRQVTEQIATTGEPVKYEETAVIKGIRRYFYTVCFPIRGESGQVIAVGGMSVDLTERKQAEEALGEGEATLMALIEHAPEPFLLVNTQGTILACSRLWAQRLGKNVKELIGASFHRYLPASTALRQGEFLERAINTGQPIRLADMWGTRHFVIQLTPIFDLTGKVSKVAILAVDITDRRQMEEALRQSEERYRTITEGSLAGVCLVQGGKFRYVNPVLAAIFGYRPEELIDRLGPLDLTHPDDRPRFARDIEDNIKFKELKEPKEKDSFKGLRKDGSIIYCEVLARSVDYQGRPAIIVTLVDVTERKRSQEALEASETKYRELVENANSIIVRVNPEGKITFFNEFAQKFFNYREDEIIGRSVFESIVPEFDSSGTDLKGQIRKIFQSPDNYQSYENENLTRDGRRVWVGWTNKAVYDQAGRLKELQCVGIDLTEKREMEETLQKFSRELEQRVQERTAQLQAVTARLEHIVAATPAIIIAAEVNPPCHITFVSDYIRKLGYEPRNLLGTPYFRGNQIHPEDREKLQWAEPVLFQECQVALQYRLQKTDGSCAWISNITRVEKDESGVPAEIVACLTDITWQKQLEQKLEILSSPEGKIRVWEQGSNIFSDLAPTFMDQSWSRVKDCLKAAFRGETTTGVSLQLRSRDGTFLEALLTAGPLQARKSDYAGAIGVIIELKRQKKDLH
ncbi:MAG: PAS domain S-box protein, partial [Deltaproteobacteria bacterium]